MKLDWIVTEESAPSFQPVTLERAKEHLRVDSNTEDALIGLYLAAATREIEDATGRSFASRSWRLTMNTWPAGATIRLPRPPIRSINSIQILDRSENVITVPTMDYGLVASDPGYLWMLRALPNHDPAPVGAYQITYTAGWASAADVPAALGVAILLTLGHRYENREAVNVGSGLTAAAAPMAVARLVAMWRAQQ